jgi:hypothetical protein
MRNCRSVQLFSIIVLVFCYFTNASGIDTANITIGPGDSLSSASRLDDEFAGKAITGQTLSIVGMSLNIAGDILPWLLANPRNAGNAGIFIGTGLCLVTSGSTMACVGTTVIRKWSTDHIKDPPETRAWTTYKVGMALTYVGAIGIIAGAGTGNIQTFLEYGIPAYLAGEVLFLISSIQSVVYTSSVNSKRGKKEFELVAMPTIDFRGGAGYVLVLSLF